MPPTITCPKCAHEQTNPVECESCGLIFRKYAQARERSNQQMAGTTEPAEKDRRSQPVLIGLGLFLVAITAGTTFYLAKEPQPQATFPHPSGITSEIEQPATASMAPEPTPQVVTQTRQQSQPATYTAPGNPIEHAKNGTVAIETPWGKGSGFFITDTTIVTNKHVIQPIPEQIEEIRHKVDTGRRLIDLEQEKLARFRQQLAQMHDGPSRLQLLIIIQEMERQLAEVLPKQEEAANRLRKMEATTASSDIKVFLADGTEFTANSTQLSPSRDLALLSVYTSKAVVLSPAAKNSALNQGERVFTIGNPVGLRNTVTAGVFSGYRQYKTTGEVMLQTDAPINPGNSGGPLIDEQGRVHGINTMIIRNTQGIGFAIPIQEVFDEFSITPPQG
ncbi:MAG: trypsin-like peptidase domain-containing protein [Desulfobulbus sp.]|nr:trypsin-like peptidase domain-containing protein [Desulfobulbus sp.]